MPSLYTKLVSGLVFPLHEKMKGHDTVAIRRSLEQSQWLSTGQITQIQTERLRVFLKQIAQDVPYYKKLFQDVRFVPDDIRSVDDLQKLPFLTKPVIRENTEALKSIHATSLSRFNTGGSSGEPLVFYIGNERVSHDVAEKWRATRWWDVDIGDREIVVWGSPIELGSQDRVREIRDKLLRTKLIPAFEMSEANLDRFIEQIRAFKPKMLFGYPSSLSLIARHAERRGQIMNDLGIKVAFVTSERLYDNQRETISRIFGCPVANGYGGRDAGFIAHQCPSGNMHLSAEDIIVEIIDSDGNALPAGQPGEITVTHLATSEFPFVRYRTGDIGTLDNRQCECGRGLPLLKEIQGRTTDFIVAEDGTIMHGLALIYVIRDVAGVKNFKIEQESLRHTRVLLETDNMFNENSINDIREGLLKRLGKNVTLDIERVDDIPREKSGKFRYIVSKVSV